MIFGKKKNIGVKNIKFYLNNFHKNKIYKIINNDDIINQLNFNHLDNISNYIYKTTKCELKMETHFGGFFSYKRKEIGLNLDENYQDLDFNIEISRIKDLYVILFHEIAHFFQYEYGKDIDRKTLFDYVFFERQAEIISLNIISQLEKRFNIKLLDKEYKPSYFSQEDIIFLKNYHKVY
jgi:hypothetical protein